MGGAIQWAQQPNLGGSYDAAFKQGYGLMDSLYKQTRENQLRSKLSEMYAQYPDEDPMKRMQRAIPILATYGSPMEAIKLEGTMQNAEMNQLYKQQMMQNAQARAGQGKLMNIRGNLVRIGADGAVEDLGAYGTPTESLVPVEGPDGVTTYIPKSDAPGKVKNTPNISDYNKEYQAIDANPNTSDKDKNTLKYNLNKKYSGLGVVKWEDKGAPKSSSSPQSTAGKTKEWSFNTIEDFNANKANIPVGSKVTIKNKGTATWYGE